MDQQQITITLFTVGQLVTILLAAGGWIVALKLTTNQLKRQHADSLRSDEERLKRDLMVKTVADLIAVITELRKMTLKASASLEAVAEFLRVGQFDTPQKIAFGQSLFPDFNHAWQDQQLAGINFVLKFDSCEPVVHQLIPARDKILYHCARAADCKKAWVTRFNQIVTAWFESPQAVLDIDSMQRTLNSCRKEFAPVEADLLDAAASMTARLQNDFIAPLFGHIVDPNRPMNIQGDSKP